MSINPVSDIVLDVARAADPVKSRVAVEALSRGESNQASIGGFDHALTDTAPRNSYEAGGSESAKILPRVEARTKAYKGLEQLILKSLLENMLPKDTSGAVFGAGTAGDIWRSFLADQLATQVGKTVDLGIIRQPITGPKLSPTGASSHNRVQSIVPTGLAKGRN